VERATARELVLADDRIRALEEDPASALLPSDCLERLPDAYFQEFTLPAVIDHVSRLCALTTDSPFDLSVRRVEDDTAGDAGPDYIPVEITVLSFDVEGMLGLLTGMLGVSDVDIRSGSVYTLRREIHSAVPGLSRRGFAARFRQASRARELPSRRIVDRFFGRVPSGADIDTLQASLFEFLGAVLPYMLPGNDRDTARRLVNESVADRLRQDTTKVQAGLFPIEVTLTPTGPATRMTIVGQDTPYFLYSLSTALTLQGVSIEAVSINTHDQVISDTVEIVDLHGEPITDAGQLDRIRFSVLLTKQFTYFLGMAPDPYAALVRFEAISQEIVTKTQHDGLAGILSDPLILQDLARLLGTSDFLWEDFIRGQYENLIPMLSESETEFSTAETKIAEKLEAELAPAGSHEERVAVLNRFKDREAYLIDLEHILKPDRDFFFLSSKLSVLADAVVRAALQIARGPSERRYGVPRTVAGLPAVFAVFGLGKLGGRAIGYASDLELLFVYSDNGNTDGDESITNNEYFERFFADAVACIESRREGIFQIDLRLRPYSAAGPHAVSLESFNRYYGRDGDAHSYEKLALTRLRFIAGDPEFGARVEHLRDDLVYGSDTISLSDVRDLRNRQLAEKASGERLNAKFSPGGLVDLEYSLQILLVQHGRSNIRLRTPSLHAGLEELSRTGVMDQEEANRLVRAYRFLRNVINGLRMLRGNAQDLFMPEAGSLEFGHLARRMGYGTEGELSPQEKLRIEFEARTAAVRAFIERHLGRESIPGDPSPTPADLALGRRLPEPDVESLLHSAGLAELERARVNLTSLAGSGEQRDLFSELVGLAWPLLAAASDADMALNNWDRYVGAVGNPVRHFRSLLRQPAKLDLMLNVFSASQFLAEILIRTPAFLEWSLDRSVVGGERSEEAMLADLRNELADDQDRKTALRWYRQREILRIGTRDICLGVSMEVITREISSLAAAIVRADLDVLLEETPDLQDAFCILAFGKLGGRELNYSSDIDLLGVFDDGTVGPDAGGRLVSVLDRLRDDLSSRTSHGHVFRVDYRLRPHGRSGALVQGTSAVERYYQTAAAAWEHQALLKLSPVAGNLQVGSDLLERIKPGWVSRWDTESVTESIRRMRTEAIRQSERRGDDIKSGHGSIRDVEFTIQGLQMINAAVHPSILTGNTFEAIRRLESVGVLMPETAAHFAKTYELLRRVEHFLQIYEDRQEHSLPNTDRRLRSLARLISGGTDPDTALSELRQNRDWAESAYKEFVETGTVTAGVSSRPRDDG